MTDAIQVARLQDKRDDNLARIAATQTHKVSEIVEWSIALAEAINANDDLTNYLHFRGGTS